ncbi:MAG: hypothetical protein AAGI08_00650 [Bacteroidota bacterium]
MKKLLLTPTLAVLTLALFAFSDVSTAMANSDDEKSPITKKEVAAAQQAWGNGIVTIGNAFTANKDYRQVAADHVRKFYAYGNSSILFKPTLAAEDQFRGDFDEALSYFVGTEGTEDGGFAIAPYTNVRWENEGTVIDPDGDMAVAMGNYFFTGTDGNETKVEYSFAYMKDDNGDLKIVLHHSSLPFAAASDPGPITMDDVAAAQQAWGNGIVKIGNAFTANEDYRQVAADHVREFYAYGSSTILFKPTLAAEDQFRGDFDEALSYFVGTEGTEDGGFAIAPYTNVRWENEGTVIDPDGEMATAMGNYFFTGTDGNETKVEYSFVYMRGDDGDLDIVLHHSSLPFAPAN